VYDSVSESENEDEMPADSDMQEDSGYGHLQGQSEGEELPQGGDLGADFHKGPVDDLGSLFSGVKNLLKDSEPAQASDI